VVLVHDGSLSAAQQAPSHQANSKAFSDDNPLGTPAPVNRSSLAVMSKVINSSHIAAYESDTIAAAAAATPAMMMMVMVAIHTHNNDNHNNVCMYVCACVVVVVVLVMY
jgi:hypothetical protein